VQIPGFDESMSAIKRLNITKPYIKVAIQKIHNKFITREYSRPEDLLTRDKTREYGEYEFIVDAIEELNKIHDGEEFIFTIKI
jgi:hypothetical protein